MLSGLPEGNVLGQLLFLIFVNDIGDRVKHSTLLLFADDSRLTEEVNNIEDAEKLQEDLNAVMIWYDNCYKTPSDLMIEPTSSVHDRGGGFFKLRTSNSLNI